MAASTTEPPVGASTCVRQPGVHRPHRHFHREGDQEGDEDRDLDRHRQRQLVPVEDAEAATRFEEQVDQRDQHQQRAEQV